MPHEPKQLIEQFQAAERDRQPWEHDWQDVSNYVLPVRSFTAHQSGPPKRPSNVFEDTAVEDADRLSAGLSGLLTNPAIKWFGLTTSDPVLDEKAAVRRWLDQVQDLMLSTFSNPAVNMGSALAEIYQDLVAFGTGTVYLREPEPGETIPFKMQARPLGEVYLRENSQGVVDTVFRRFELTYRQVVQEFGDAAPERVREAMAQPGGQGGSKKITLLHAVLPRQDRDPGRHDGPNKPVASIYLDLEKKQIIREGGFDRFPFLTPRWKKTSGEVWGRSPAMKVLPSIKTANAMTKSVLLGAQRAVEPPVQMPDDGFVGPLRMNPGAVNYYRAGSRDRVEAIPVQGDVMTADAILQRTEARIGRAFYRDLMELPMLDRMTAQEVVQRMQEKMQVLSPVVGRLQGELLSPLIRLTYSFLEQAQMLPAMPEVLAEAEIQVEYTSPMALSQRSSEITTFQQLMMIVAQAAQFDPQAADTLDSDAMIRRTAASLRAPAGTLRTPEQVQATRRQRQEMMQAQQAAATAKDGAKAGLDTAKAAKEAGVAP